jgi:hypothetical protein
MEAPAVSEATWILLAQAALAASVPVYLAWQARQKAAAEAGKTDAEATDIVTKTALGMIDPLERRLKLLEEEVRRLRAVIAELEQTIRDQAVVVREQTVVIREQQHRIDLLVVEAARLQVGIDVLTEQVLAMGQQPAFKR